jgi:small-conductance mechanosensitive channel
VKAESIKTARPHLRRAATAGAVAVLGMVVASFGEIRRKVAGEEVEASARLIALAGAVLLLIGGVLAVRALARAVRSGSAEHLGEGRAALLSLVITIAGYLLVLSILVYALGYQPRGLLLGGAITGIVLGIAAQQMLGNFFAGIVLLVARPFTVGEHVVLRSGALGGEYEGDVTDMTLVYVKLVTEYGPVALPNAGVLAAAIGPGARAPKDEDGEEEEQATAERGGVPSTDPSRGPGG